VNSKADLPVERLQWTPELVDRFWSAVARTRLDELAFGRLAGAELIKLIQPHLRPGGTHLDYGAGSGHMVRLLVEGGWRVAAYDPSADRSAVLAGQVAGRPEFLGVVGPESGDRFDVVLVIEVIEHILDADLPASLERLQRFVKPGGRIIVSTPNNEDLDLGSAYCPVSNRLFHRWQHVRSFTPRKLEETFGNCGFRRVFLGLADFSHDRAVYDAVNSAAEREKRVRDHLKSQGDGAGLQRQFDEVRDLLGALPAGRMDQAIVRLTRQRGLRGWFEAILFHRRQAAELVSLLTEVAGVWKQLESRAGVLRQIADAQAANPARSRADGLDLRSGRETTIVYVGERAG
jgi:SAM-dependent methyltransferase